jgi:hypothetical protein
MDAAAAPVCSQWLQWSGGPGPGVSKHLNPYNPNPNSAGWG